MGQKANILTLRSQNENLNFTSLNSKEFTNALEFITVLTKSLEKKGIIITNSCTNKVGNTCFLFLNVFYKTQKLAKYKKKTLQKTFLALNERYTKNTEDIKKQSSIEKRISKQTAILFKNIVNNKKLVLRVVLLNKELKKEEKTLKELYFKFNEFKTKLFSRRFNLFIDFLKLTCLIQKKRINASVFLSTLGTIFKILPKKLHNNFFKFLKSLIQETLLQEKQELKTTKIIGVKIIINGKLKGKLRATSVTINKGKIGAQTLSNDIEFSQKHVYTMYGCFGFQL